MPSGKLIRPARLAARFIGAVEEYLAGRGQLAPANELVDQYGGFLWSVGVYACDQEQRIVGDGVIVSGVTLEVMNPGHAMSFPQQAALEWKQLNRATYERLPTARVRGLAGCSPTHSECELSSADGIALGQLQPTAGPARQRDRVCLRHGRL